MGKWLISGFPSYFYPDLEGSEMDKPSIYTHWKNSVGFDTACILKLFNICLCLLSSIILLAPCLSPSAQPGNSSQPLQFPSPRPLQNIICSLTLNCHSSGSVSETHLSSHNTLTTLLQVLPVQKQATGRDSSHQSHKAPNLCLHPWISPINFLTQTTVLP